jgi:CRP-like cAMP-binding protein
LARDVIFSEGAPAKEVFLLISGCVRTTQVSENGVEVILRLVLPGEVICALRVGTGKHTSTAQAVQECRALVWDTATFEAIVERFPILQRNTHRILDRRICELEQRLCEISTSTASPRLAQTLVRLLGQMGRESNGEIEINIPQESMAQMTAMTPFTVSRVLSKWEQQGLVSVRRGRIAVRSYEGLLRLCQRSKIAGGLKAAPGNGTTIPKSASPALNPPGQKQTGSSNLSDLLRGRAPFRRPLI